MADKLRGYAAVCTACHTPHLWYGEKPNHCIKCGEGLKDHGVIVTEERLKELEDIEAAFGHLQIQNLELLEKNLGIVERVTEIEAIAAKILGRKE